MSSKGAAIKNIVSVKELKQIPITMPNIQEQEKIIVKLDKIKLKSQQNILKIENQLNYLNNLKSSILYQRLFLESYNLFYKIRFYPAIINIC